MRNSKGFTLYEIISISFFNIFMLLLISIIDMKSGVHNIFVYKMQTFTVGVGYRTFVAKKKYFSPLCRITKFSYDHYQGMW